MWPAFDYYWPRKKPTVATVQEFEEVFRMFGYERCATEIWEPETEKIALYTVAGEPTHVARQLANGTWTSKLSVLEDIGHDTLGDLPLEYPYCCSSYGIASHFFRRPRNFRRTLLKRLVTEIARRMGR